MKDALSNLRKKEEKEPLFDYNTRKLLFIVSLAMIPIMIYIQTQTDFSPFGTTQKENSGMRSAFLYKLPNMDCTQLKNHLEKNNEFKDFPENVRLPYAARDKFFEKDCIKTVGYLKYEAIECTQWHIERTVGGYYTPSIKYEVCDEYSFPRVDNTIYFPIDWYYLDPNTNKIYKEPQEFLDIYFKDKNFKAVQKELIDED